MEVKESLKWGVKGNPKWSKQKPKLRVKRSPKWE
jgi:hypothetical protein